MLFLILERWNDNMDIIKDVFIELDSIKDVFTELVSGTVSRAVWLLKEFVLGLVKGLKIHLEVIIEIFNIVKERYLTK